MKTKAIISVVFAILFFCGNTQAQDALPYRHFQSFKKDTIRYLDYNFTLRGDQYVDKTAGDLFKDLELPVLYVSRPIMQLGNNQKHSIYIVAMDLVIRLTRNINDEDDWDDSKDYYIRIVLKDAMDAEDFANALYSDERNKGRNGLYYCTPQLYEVLKNYKLEFIMANELLFEDRRKLRENNTTEDIAKVKKILETEKTNWRKIIRAEKRVLDK